MSRQFFIVLTYSSKYTFLPIKFSRDLFIEASHTLYKSGFQNAFRYYDLKNIYGDDLPSVYRSYNRYTTYADENSKCCGLFGDFDSTKPNISLVFKNKNDKMYSEPFNKFNNDTLFLSLGKGDFLFSYNLTCLLVVLYNNFKRIQNENICF